MPFFLLLISNIFMTFAWYGHLKNHQAAPLWIVVLSSWGIAFFEYCFQVPANRLGAQAGLSAAELKIDRTFITDVHERPRSQVILQALGAAAAQFGLHVVAEGVETVAELDYLLSATSITTAQGFLFARPMVVEELVAQRAELEGRLRGLAARTVPAA